MNRVTLAVFAVLLAASCKKKEEASAPAAAAPAEQAAPATGSPLEASQERWKPYIDIANYSKSAVEIELNGSKLGAWDRNERVEIAPMPGANRIVVNVAPGAKGDIRVYVKRTSPVNRASTKTDELLKLDLRDKPGRHEASFEFKP